ncbi:beta-galactosidase [Georgenia satyanarayanai]|uniref:Beta-galactosidase n=1 Tax=Georgenia satyanarayanai TaxID=860221 RepID=A0A2Y9BUZ3_9MICO|nr:beta-galactosidase [Georgenia satyanarayanai]PYG01702.1 beta-galactosidase [Georgenia satyanarayanai]SSA36502.1 beta-galactosidase [Georgenia satyanarayanai]
MSNHPWPTPATIAYGGDYNPEQWPREVWDEDVVLMREAGVTMVSVGIFSWGLLEPEEGVFDFAWLDELLDLLHANGIAVDLGTPTASPPAWFFATYPHALAVDKHGVVQGFGSRGMASHSAPEYRRAAARIAGELARRYGQHPAVVMWHVHNEYGVPVGEDFSPNAVAAWRVWLQERYGSLDALNAAWGTAFWGQRYGRWEHVVAPAATPTTVNPAMKLDWARFTDDQLRACFRAERDAIRAHADQPVTTNFMAHQSWNTDLWAWAQEVDIVSDDHYLWSPDPDAHVALALSADLTRSVARGRPWILMEHSTSAVNWQGRNIAKRPGEMHRNALTHVGRGADGIMFFQWRASRSGAEKFHSAMVPHAGPTSRIFREVASLGARLGAIGELQDTRVRAQVAVLYDWESLWAQDLEWRPSDALQFRERMRAYYERLWRDGVQVDFAHPGDDLSGYRLVVAPASYLLTAAQGENLTRYVAGGGTLLVSCFAAVVDEHDAVHHGGFGAPLREALGLTVEEFLPMREGESCAVELDGRTLTADVWAEDLAVDGAQVRGTYSGGPADGAPAVTRHEHGDGVGWYVSTRLDVAALAPVLAAVYDDAGIAPSSAPEGVELMTRHGETADYVVAVNHRDDAVTVPLEGTELLSGTDVTGVLTLPAGEVAVVRSTPGGGR